MSFPSPHPVKWVMPAPLWGASSGTAAPAVMREPALLTIADDRFMDALSAKLAADPPGLQAFAATAVSHRVRPPGRSDDSEPGGPPALKLYQPAHGEFNLVAASLVCQIPGLPEHQVHPEQHERVSFVLRCLRQGKEWAWSGPTSTAMSWQPVSDPAAVAPDEQLLPLFGVGYALSEKQRRLFVGLIPTASVETFVQSSPAPAASGPPPTTDLMLMAFDSRVYKPLTQLAGAHASGADTAPGSPMQVLEFASFLNDWFPDSWAAVTAGGTSAVNQPLFDWLGANPAATGLLWLDVLKTAWSQRDGICAEPGAQAGGLLSLDLASVPSAADALRGKIAGATLETPGTSIPGAPTGQAPKLDPLNPYMYAVRCVYQRPECLLGGDVVSDPSEPFEIASFYDFDAPARQVTISLPPMTSIADLRKFRKNVNFLISQELHSQMDRIINLKSTIDGNVKADGGGGGGVRWICSFSIPIITICALFVLLMFVILLNIVFWWLPFFELCLPVPE